jgi:U32 family peptidase
MVDGIGAAEAIKTQNNKIEIYGSTGLNVWNHLIAEQLSKTSNDPSKNPGITFKSLTVSPELSKNEIKRLISTSHTKNIPTSFELVVQGNIESMVTEDCLPLINPKSNGLKTMHDTKKEFIGIIDAKKRVFPVNTDYNGRTHILNAVELCLVDYMPSILRMGINSVVIDARGKPPSYALEMAAIYSNAVEKTEKGNELKKTLNMLKNNVKKISTGGITTGNFIRGVK